MVQKKKHFVNGKQPWSPSYTVKFQKIISPGAYIFQRSFLRGVFLEGLIFGGAYVWREICVSNQLGWLVVGRKLTIFALFYLVFEGKFQVQAPPGAFIGRGDLTKGFLRYDFGGLIFGGAYTWRGLFSQFYSISSKLNLIFGIHVMVNIDNYKKGCPLTSVT